MWNIKLFLIILIGFHLTNQTVSDTKIITDDLRKFEFLLNKRQEIPLTVPKRAAVVFDRLLLALQKALANDLDRGRYKDIEVNSIVPNALRSTGLNQVQYDVDDGAVNNGVNSHFNGFTVGGNHNTDYIPAKILRCYFNAVTCFKK